MSVEACLPPSQLIQTKPGDPLLHIALAVKLRMHSATLPALGYPIQCTPDCGDGKTNRVHGSNRRGGCCLLGSPRALLAP